MCLLTQFQDAHLLHQVKAQSCLRRKINNGKPVFGSIADTLLLAVFLIPSVKHIGFGSISIFRVFLKLFNEKGVQPIVDDTHGLQPVSLSEAFSRPKGK